MKMQYVMPGEICRTEMEPGMVGLQARLQASSAKAGG
jgi:hypothetical protein